MSTRIRERGLEQWTKDRVKEWNGLQLCWFLELYNGWSLRVGNAEGILTRWVSNYSYVDKFWQLTCFGVKRNQSISQEWGARRDLRLLWHDINRKYFWASTWSESCGVGATQHSESRDGGGKPRGKPLEVRSLGESSTSRLSTLLYNINTITTPWICARLDSEHSQCSDVVYQIWRVFSPSIDHKWTRSGEQGDCKILILKAGIFSYDIVDLRVRASSDVYKIVLVVPIACFGNWRSLTATPSKNVWRLALFVEFMTWNLSESGGGSKEA